MFCTFPGEFHLWVASPLLPFSIIILLKIFIFFYNSRWWSGPSTCLAKLLASSLFPQTFVYKQHCLNFPLFHPLHSISLSSSSSALARSTPTSWRPSAPSPPTCSAGSPPWSSNPVRSDVHRSDYHHRDHHQNHHDRDHHHHHICYSWRSSAWASQLTQLKHLPTNVPRILSLYRWPLSPSQWR